MLRGPLAYPRVPPSCQVVVTLDIDIVGLLSVLMVWARSFHRFWALVFSHGCKLWPTIGGVASLREILLPYLR